jgi:hypothetical protein
LARVARQGRRETIGIRFQQDLQSRERVQPTGRPCLGGDRLKPLHGIRLLKHHVECLRLALRRHPAEFESSRANKNGFGGFYRERRRAGPVRDITTRRRLTPRVNSQRRVQLLRG